MCSTGRSASSFTKRESGMRRIRATTFKPARRAFPIAARRRSANRTAHSACKERASYRGSQLLLTFRKAMSLLGMTQLPHLLWIYASDPVTLQAAKLVRIAPPGCGGSCHFPDVSNAAFIAKVGQLPFLRSLTRSAAPTLPATGLPAHRRPRYRGRGRTRARCRGATPAPVLLSTDNRV